MALEIKIVNYGQETVVGKTDTGLAKAERLNCLAELYDDGKLIAKRMVQNIDPDDEADRDTRVKAAFAGFEVGAKPEPEKVPLDVAAKTATWKPTLTDPVLPAEKVAAVEPK